MARRMPVHRRICHRRGGGQIRLNSINRQVRDCRSAISFIGSCDAVVAWGIGDEGVSNVVHLVPLHRELRIENRESESCILDICTKY